LAGAAFRHRCNRRGDGLDHARLPRTSGPLDVRAWAPRTGDRSTGPGGGRRMKLFAELYSALDRTTKTNEKVAALKRYLAAAQPEEAAGAISSLLGRRPKRLLESRKLAQWAIEEAGVPDWIFGECYSAVGDGAETIALLLPPAESSSPHPLHYWVEERLLPLR